MTSFKFVKITSTLKPAAYLKLNLHKNLQEVKSTSFIGILIQKMSQNKI